LRRKIEAFAEKRGPAAFGSASPVFARSARFHSGPRHPPEFHPPRSIGFTPTVNAGRFHTPCAAPAGFFRKGKSSPVGRLTIPRAAEDRFRIRIK
jgi:hypothetical protein